jgi:hypothetical protein
MPAALPVQITVQRQISFQIRQCFYVTFVVSGGLVFRHDTLGVHLQVEEKSLTLILRIVSLRRLR